jgi:hypothetical protein
MAEDKSIPEGLGVAGAIPEAMLKAFGFDFDPLSRKRWNEPDFHGVLLKVRDMSHAAAVKVLKQELSRSGHDDKGPQSCTLLLELGIRQFKLGEIAVAEATFNAGLRMARDIADKTLVGGFLHELSMVAWDQGKHQKALELARDSLVEKLVGFHAAAAKGSDFGGFLKARFDPFPAIDRLASLLAIVGQPQQAEVLFVFLRDSCESRNDLPVLVQKLIAHASVLSAMGRTADAEHAVSRAVWTGRVAGTGVDELLARTGIVFTQPELKDCPVQSNCSGREALEQSLISQYREIALGLLADRLAQGDDLSERGWWQQFCSQRRAPPPYVEDEDDAEFQAFQDEIFQAVASRKIKPISPADLLTRSITIYGARIPCWQEGTINRHLAEIGSSLRLFMAGTDVARATKLLSMLGHSPADPVHPADFILGYVKPMTALAKANFFDFAEELAISPYLNPDSPGLHDQGRVVLRDFLIRRCTEFHDTQPVPTLEEVKQQLGPGELLRLALIEEAARREGGSIEDNSREETAEYCRALNITWEDMMGNGMLGHELGHMMQRFPHGVPGPFSSWKAIMRDDICRFAQTPRTSQEMGAAFRRNFEGLGEKKYYPFFLGMFPPGDSPTEYPLEKIVAELVKDRLLTKLPDESYHFAGFVRRQ